MRRAISTVLMVFVSGCGRSRAAISGDVYFAASDGEGRRASDVVVYLVGSPDSLGARRARVCDAYQSSALRLKQALLGAISPVVQAGQTREGIRLAASSAPRVESLKDSIRDLSQQTLVLVSSILDSLKIDTSASRIDAHFAFSNVSPGHYVLVARGLYGGLPRMWMSQVTVARDSIRADLGTKQEFELTEFSCGITVDDLQPVEHSDPATLKRTIARLNAMDRADAAESREEERKADPLYSPGDSAAIALAYAITAVDVRPMLQAGSPSSEISAAGVAVGTVVTATYVIDMAGSVTHVRTDNWAARGPILVRLSERRYNAAKKGNQPVFVKVAERFTVK